MEYGGPIVSRQRSLDFLGRRHISTSGFASTATETAALPYFCPFSPAIGTEGYKWTVQ